MTRFLEDAIARAGLMPVLAARRAGDLDSVRAGLASLRTADLLALGAVADLLRTEEIGAEVRIHDEGEEAGVVWVTAPVGASDLEVLREAAVARIASSKGARTGIDWSRHGYELAQVALGFGVTDLRGSLMRKSGLPIFDDEMAKVKGEGMVDLKSLKRRELAKLVTHAGRIPVFVSDEERPSSPLVAGARPSASLSTPNEAPRA